MLVGVGLGQGAQAASFSGHVYIMRRERARTARPNFGKTRECSVLKDLLFQLRLCNLCQLWMLDEVTQQQSPGKCKDTTSPHSRGGSNIM